MSKVIIRNARLAFPDLFTPQQYQGTGPFQYRATFLINPSDPCKALVDATIKSVAVEKWGAKAASILPAVLQTPNKCCFSDGNLKAYNGYEGNWALTATRNQDAGAPLIVDRDKSPLAASSGKIYSGCYVNGTVDIWAQDNQYGKGIRATLINVQFVKDGESFGGAAAASVDDLDELEFDEDETLI